MGQRGLRTCWVEQNATCAPTEGATVRVRTWERMEPKLTRPRRLSRDRKGATGWHDGTINRSLPDGRGLSRRGCVRLSRGFFTRSPDRRGFREFKSLQELLVRCNAT